MLSGIKQGRPLDVITWSGIRLVATSHLSRWSIVIDGHQFIVHCFPSFFPADLWQQLRQLATSRSPSIQELRRGISHQVREPKRIFGINGGNVSTCYYDVCHVSVKNAHWRFDIKRYSLKLSTTESWSSRTEVPDLYSSWKDRLMDAVLLCAVTCLCAEENNNCHTVNHPCKMTLTLPCIGELVFQHLRSTNDLQHHNNQGCSERGIPALLIGCG